jgi:hypothetical protein
MEVPWAKLAYHRIRPIIQDESENVVRCCGKSRLERQLKDGCFRDVDGTDDAQLVELIERPRCATAPRDCRC